MKCLQNNIFWLGLILYIPVNSYDHVGMVSSPSHTFSSASLTKQFTRNTVYLSFKGTCKFIFAHFSSQYHKSFAMMSPHIMNTNLRSLKNEMQVNTVRRPFLTNLKVDRDKFYDSYNYVTVMTSMTML